MCGLQARMEVCTTTTMPLQAVVTARGPSLDIHHFRPVLDQGFRRVPVQTATFDAGYNAELARVCLRPKNSYADPALIGHRSNKPPSGYWRRQMGQRLHLTRYSHGWQAESVNSMLKRVMGSALRERT